MAYDKESILQQYESEISEILEVTRENPEDEGGKGKVAAILARSLSMIKRRTGEDRAPKDTELYKLAPIIRQAKSQEEFDRLLEQELPKAKSGILEKYNLDWSLPWTKEAKKRGGRRVKATAAPEKPAEDVAARVSAIEAAIEQIQKWLTEVENRAGKNDLKQLETELDEIRQKLRAHEHDTETGKAYIMERKGL